MVPVIEYGRIRKHVFAIVETRLFPTPWSKERGFQSLDDHILLDKKENNVHLK